MTEREKLKDKAALIAFTTLLQRNEYGKDENLSIKHIATTAWDYAEAFIIERPATKEDYDNLEKAYRDRGEPLPEWYLKASAEIEKTKRFEDPRRGAGPFKN